jgi:hypothetical protein
MTTLEVQLQENAALRMQLAGLRLNYMHEMQAYQASIRTALLWRSRSSRASSVIRFSDRPCGFSAGPPGVRVNLGAVFLLGLWFGDQLGGIGGSLADTDSAAGSWM